MIEIVVALFLWLILFTTKTKEGYYAGDFVEKIDYTDQIIDSIKAALNDPRLNKSQLIELEDALGYATYIKNIRDI